MLTTLHSLLAYIGAGLAMLAQNDQIMALWNSHPDKVGAGKLSAVLAIVGTLMTMASNKQAVVGLNKIPGFRAKPTIEVPVLGEGEKP